MQFKRRMLALVLLGEKTQTRRINPPRHKVGSLQPVQCGYRDKAHARILITGVRRQKLKDMTLEEAKAEGFISVLAFVGYVMDINPKHKIMPDTEMTVYEFELQEDAHDH